MNANYTFGYDSNVFTQNVARGSSTENWTFGTSYTRRAGLIAVSAAVNWNFGDFGQFASQNFVDPSYTLSFTKGTGRTTGSLTFTAQRTDQPDPDANDRAIAWNYNVGLNLRYPVNDRYYFTERHRLQQYPLYEQGSFHQPGHADRWHRPELRLRFQAQFQRRLHVRPEPDGQHHRLRPKLHGGRQRQPAAQADRNDQTWATRNATAILPARPGTTAPSPPTPPWPGGIPTCSAFPATSTRGSTRRPPTSR